MNDDEKTREELLGELTALRESSRVNEERWRLALEGGVDGSFDWSPRTGRLVYSGRCAEVFGCETDRAETSLSEWRDHIHPDDRERVGEHLRLFLKGSTATRGVEHRVLCADGTYKWVFARGKVVSRGHDGRPSRVIGAFIDVTERKAYEDALRESEAKFRDLAEKSVVGVYLIQDGQLKYANQRFAETMGYGIEEITDAFRIERLAHPDDWPLVRKNLEKRISGELGSLHYEFRIITKDGEIRDIEVYSSRTTYQGRPAVIGTALDITKRKQAEGALTRSEAELRALVESMSDIIMVVDKSGRFVKVLSEPSWSTVSDTGICGRTFKDLFPGEGAALFLKSVKRALTIRRTVSIDHCVRARERECWFSTAISPMTDGLAVCVARDITDLKTAERALQAKSVRLEETNTALKVLLANVEEAKREVEETMASNIRILVLPYIERLSRLNLDNVAKAYVDVVEENLKNIASPVLHGLSKFNLTPMEIQVANYIKDGKTTKEMMGLLHISKGAIDTHRYNIRRKLGINKEKVNLCARLRSIR